MASLDFENEKNNFREFYNEKHETLESAKDAFIAIISSIISEEFDISAVTGRVKDRDESVQKFSLKYQSKLEQAQTEYEIKDHITDLIGLRVVSLYESDIEKIKDVLEDEFELIDITNKIKDIESKEDSFGYKGLHVDLKLKAPRCTMREYSRYSCFKFEVQIRTIIQDAWSVLDHKIKYKKSIPLPLKRRINTLAALFELADREFYSIREKTIKAAEEEKEKSAVPSETETLNVFSFLAIIDDLFPEYDFIPFKVDGFVSEITSYGDMSPSQFKAIIDEYFVGVEEYKDSIEATKSRPHAFNPYTEIRHVLYKSDTEKYQRILYNLQRTKFDQWIVDEQK
jgi:putative GTP pyrophosphokinase